METQKDWQEELVSLAGEKVNQVELDNALTLMAAKFKIGKSILKKELKRIKDRHKELLRESNPRLIDISDERPVHLIEEELIRRMKEANVFFLFGENLCVLREEKMKPLVRPEEIQAAIGALFDCVVYLNNKEKFRHYSYPLQLLHSPSLNILPKINLISSIPLFDKEFELVDQGYHAKDGLYVVGKLSMKKCKDLFFIEKLLEEFCFKGNVDKVNFIAFMITSFFHHHFVGDVPVLSLEGNQPGIGKSELAQVIALIRNENRTPTMTFTNDEAELEKIMCAVILDGAKTLIFDNIKPRRWENGEIDSAPLERSITDKKISFRLLGTNRTLRVDNHFQFILTHNFGKMSKDMLSRQVTVSLYYEGDPGKRDFKIKNISDFLTIHKEQIISELIFIIEKWKSKGMPKAKVKHRFQNWAEVCGGILEANDFSGFLTNIDEVTLEKDNVLVELNELCSLMREGGFYRAKELLPFVFSKKLFSHYLSEILDSQKPVALGKMLGAYVDRIVEDNRGEFIFSKKIIDKTGVYYLRRKDFDDRSVA